MHIRNHIFTYNISLNQAHIFDTRLYNVQWALLAKNLLTCSSNHFDNTWIQNEGH